MEPWKYEPARDLDLSPLEKARSIRREAGLFETAGHLMWLGIVKTYLKAYHRLSIVGRERLPCAPPFVLVSNHTSHLDGLTLASVLPWKLCDRVFPVAAGDVFFETPIVSFFAASFINALPMWRRNCGIHALKELRDRLIGEPCGYILFPEGTRSRDGSMGSFRAGLGMLVAGTQVPVVPCNLQGAHRALPPGSRWPRPYRLRLVIGSPLLFEGVSDDREGWAKIARRSEDAVRALARGPHPGDGPALSPGTTPGPLSPRGAAKGPDAP